jgi:hypothetical protein
VYRNEVGFLYFNRVSANFSLEDHCASIYWF